MIRCDILQLKTIKTIAVAVVRTISNTKVTSCNLNNYIIYTATALCALQLYI